MSFPNSPKTVPFFFFTQSDSSFLRLLICYLRCSFLVNYAFFFAEEHADTMVNCGAVPVLVRILQNAARDDADGVTDPYKYEVEKACAFILGFLAIKVIKLYYLLFSYFLQ